MFYPHNVLHHPKPHEELQRALLSSWLMRATRQEALILYGITRFFDFQGTATFALYQIAQNQIEQFLISALYHHLPQMYFFPD